MMREGGQDDLEKQQLDNGCVTFRQEWVKTQSPCMTALLWGDQADLSQNAFYSHLLRAVFVLDRTQKRFQGVSIGWKKGEGENLFKLFYPTFSLKQSPRRMHRTYQTFPHLASQHFVSMWFKKNEIKTHPKRSALFPSSFCPEGKEPEQGCRARGGDQALFKASPKATPSSSLTPTFNLHRLMP